MIEEGYIWIEFCMLIYKIRVCEEVYIQDVLFKVKKFKWFMIINYRIWINLL